MQRKHAVLSFLLVLLVINCARAQTASTFLSSRSKEYERRNNLIDGDKLAVILNGLADRFVARYGTPAAAKQAMGSVGLEFALASTAVLVESNRFWKAGQFQQQDYENCVKRLAVIPQSAEEAWSQAINKLDPPRNEPVRGKVQLSVVAILGAMIIQDRLFDGSKFSELQSKRLIARMSSIPPAHLRAQSNSQGLDKYQVAITLANDDRSFINDVFRKISRSR